MTAEAKREARLAYQRAYKLTHRKQIAALQRAYYQRHKEQSLAYQKARYHANREKEVARSRAYHETHKEKINEKRRARYHANREKEAARSRAYRETHKEKIAEHQKAYREAHRCKATKGASTECSISKAKTNFRNSSIYACVDCFYFGVEHEGCFYCAHDKDFTRPMAEEPRTGCFMKDEDGKVMWLSMWEKPSARR